MKKIVLVFLLFSSTVLHSMESEKDTSLEKATLQQNYALCKSLLEKRKNSNQPSKIDPLLFLVKSKKLAELFLLHGAQVNTRNWDGSSLLHTVAHANMPWELMELYSSKGLSPELVDNFNITPLTILAECASAHDSNSLFKKLCALLNPLSQKKVKELLGIGYLPVFDILDQQTQSNCAQAMKKYLQDITTPSNRKPINNFRI